jgi:aminomethyltransferase
MLTTPYHALHKKLNARMAGFAGYDMPIQYAGGIMSEHLHTRKYASLFDVSHMGQCLLEGVHAVEMLERLTPSDFQALVWGGCATPAFSMTAAGW